MTHPGTGRHVDQIPPPDQGLKTLKILFASYLTYDTGLTLAKSSALFFYRRIFEDQSRWFSRTLWGLHTIVWAWWIACCIAIFVCIPVQQKLSAIPKKCGSTGNLWIGSATPSVVIDLIILLLPMPMLRKLQMKASRKLLLSGTFACGYA